MWSIGEYPVSVESGWDVCHASSPRGLEHGAKLFEDEGYTLEVAFRALDSGESTLMTDLRALTLTLGECRKLITKLKYAKGPSMQNVWF